MAFNLYLGKVKPYPIKITSAGCLLYDNINKKVMTILEINSNGYMWYTLPAGKVDIIDDNPEETSLRETFEETKIFINKKDVILLQKFYVRYSEFDFDYYPFRTTLNKFPDNIILGDEHKESKFVTIEGSLKIDLIPGEKECIGFVYHKL